MLYFAQKNNHNMMICVINMIKSDEWQKETQERYDEQINRYFNFIRARIGKYVI